LAERRVAAEVERPAKCIIDEGELSLGVATDDDIALVVEKIAIARLALAYFPLQVFERFEAGIEALGERGEPRPRRAAPRALACCSAPPDATRYGRSLPAAFPWRPTKQRMLEKGFSGAQSTPACLLKVQLDQMVKRQLGRGEASRRDS
jgi:hypothetical protein